MSAIGRVTRAADQSQRTQRGEDRIPAVWRARVVYVRETAGANPAGVYVTVPNFTRGEIHGPVQVVGDAPAEGDLVVAVAVEGRKNDWIVITGQAAADIEARLTQVEALASATREQLDVLDEFVEHEVTARMGRIEWDVDEELTPRVQAVEDRVTEIFSDPVPITLMNGWRDPAAYPGQSAHYIRHGDIIFLKGAVLTPSSGSNDDAFAILPAPSHLRRLSTSRGSSSGANMASEVIEVSTSGAMIVVNGSDMPSTNVTLDGLFYHL